MMDDAPHTLAQPSTERVGDGQSGPRVASVRLAVLTNCMTPYRVNLHRRLVAELPEVDLHTLVTHGRGDFVWEERGEFGFRVVEFAGPRETANDNLLRAPHRVFAERRKARRIIHYLRDNQIDAVISLIPNYASYLWTLRACRRMGVRVFVRSDANIRNERGMSAIKKRVKRAWYGVWTPWVWGVMPMGELGEQFFRQYWPRDDRIYRVPYWPDLDRFARPDEARVRSLRERFSLSADRRRVLYCGRLIPVKRVDLLIDAFARLAEERPDWDLVIAGAGPEEEALRARTPAALRRRVVWTGFLEVDDLAAAYHACHALALPSDREPWALVVPEALAAGLPVVASDVVGAAHEMVQPGVNGRTFRAGDLTGLTDALREVTDPSRWPEMREAVPGVLAGWRGRANPVAEIRRALVECGLLSGAPGAGAELDL